MTTDAVCRVTFQSDLGAKLFERHVRLRDFDHAEPRRRPTENVLDRRRTFSNPSMVIRIAMPLDPAKTPENGVKSFQHFSRDPNASVLASGNTDPVPLWALLTFHRASQAETPFSIHESRGPRSLKIVGGGVHRRVRGMRDVIIARPAARSCFKTTTAITVENFFDGRSRLRPLYGTQMCPEQGNGCLSLFEAPCSPNINAVFIWPHDLAHPQHGDLEAAQNLRDPAWSALRHDRL